MSIFFPQTGHHLSGAFLTGWRANGGVMTFGYPISEPFVENGRVVQYFERARLEWHEESIDTRYVVQPTRLGYWVTEGRRHERPFQRRPTPVTLEPDSSRRFFPETGHWLSHGFKQFWERNGGLYTFGYPISEEFPERNPDTGEVHIVQYFERARFEWHPEHRGTRNEVMLGRLGAIAARSNEIDTDPVPRRSEAIPAFQSLLDPNWAGAIRTPDGAIIGAVRDHSLAIRSAPQLDATVVEHTYSRHTVTIYDIVRGEPVDGNPAWYRIGPERYVHTSGIQGFVPPAPPKTFAGRWVDVSLSHFYAVAYDGDQPVYAALITAGRDGQTPLGEYEIVRRVRNETMDAATVGIPPWHWDYYYLENVQFTQYFRWDGYAIHGNYWTPPSQFGSFSTHGCVGLRNSDAAWFWDFLSNGSIVTIHY